jgi:NitT/TauT family transport system substrate-binding protein
MRKASSFIALTAVSILALSGCAGGDASNEEQPSGANASGECETLTSVTIGLLPIIDVAPTYVGQAQGFFEEECIDLSIEMAATGGALVPSVVSGEYQFGFSNLTSLALAKENGLPIKVVAPGNYSTGIDGEDIAGIIVAPDSDIKTAKDLEGKTVSVSAVKNVSEVVEKETIEKDGGDPNSITFVELAFPDVEPAVLNHQVDAGFVLEPFLSIALNNGAKLIASPFVQAGDPFLVASYFTTDQLLAAEPDLVERFTRAITKSLDYAQEHPDATRAAFGEYTTIDPEIQAILTLPDFTSALESDDVQHALDITTKWGVLSKSLNASDLLP